ncbi:MAG: ABC transporter ATP-binding protein [Gemmatimonadales bacterium]
MVVNRVTLAVSGGEIHLLVGPNGSGKSTLARLAVGLLRPHSGRVTVAGVDPRTVASVRAGVGFAGHEAQLYDDLSAEDNLRFAARLSGGLDPTALARAALERFGASGERRTPVRRLSRGFMQRVALARSLVHRPGLVVWDEPLTGLDAPSIRRVAGVLAEEQQRGAAVLLVSHDLPDLWPLATHVHVVVSGEIRLSTDAVMPLETFRDAYAELVA